MRTFQGDQCLDTQTCLIERYCAVRIVDYQIETNYMFFIEIFKVASVFCSLAVAVLIYSDKRISVHPGGLLALISLM